MVERSQIETYGMGTIIVSPHKPGYIMAIEELKPKPATNRKVGELSVPLETEVVCKDIPESKIQVVQASLAEVMNDTDIRNVGGQFSLARMGDVYTPSESSPGVFFRSSLVIYSGDPEYPFTPTVDEEVTNPHWVPVRDFVLGREGIRPLAREIVLYSALQGNLLEESVPMELFPQGFSIRQLQNSRDKYPDRILERAS